VAGCPAPWCSAAYRPAWKQQLKSRLPGLPVARVSPASREFPPGRTSALAVNEFLLRSVELAQGFPARNFKIFPELGEIHKKARVIPRERQLFHCAIHSLVHRRRTAGRAARWRHDPGRRPIRARPGTCDRDGMPSAYSEAPPCMRWRGLAAAIQQGCRLLGYRGAIRPLHPGGKISPERRFPGSLCAPALTFRFPGPPECGGLADLHIWWCGISTAWPRAAQEFPAMNSWILRL
jgi:hypothetical protein